MQQVWNWLPKTLLKKNGDKMKKKLIYSLLTCLLLVIMFFLFFYRLGPFSTGTNTAAFLGTTFEMSLPEVQRTLSNKGIQLVDRETFANLDPEISQKKPFITDLGAEPAFAEDKTSEKNNQLLYMPSIDMFDSQVIAEFHFYENKLTFIQVNIYPLSKNKIPQIIDKISNDLKLKYKSFPKEFNKDVPDAYALIFKDSSSKVAFWINLADSNNPIIILDISYDKYSTQYESKLRKRESTAF
jgi:hypothetical protein